MAALGPPHRDHPTIGRTTAESPRTAMGTWSPRSPPIRRTSRRSRPAAPWSAVALRLPRASRAGGLCYSRFDMSARTNPRSAPTTSAACCARRALLARARRAAAGDDRRGRAARRRGRRDPRRVAHAGATSACSPPPTASSGARRGTWTSSTSSGASSRPSETHARPVPTRRATIEFAPPRCASTAGSTLDQTIFADDFAFLRDHAAPGMTPKLTIPSPSMVHYRGGRAAIDESVYPDSTSSGATSRPPTRASCAGVGELGCPYLQFDDTSLAYLNDPASASTSRRSAATPSTCTSSYIRHINEVLAGKPDGLRVTTHMCRGNYRSSWAAEGGYDFVAEALFGELESTASSSSTTTSARAASSRCGSCRREVGRARAGDHQARRARGHGRAQAADRAGGAVRGPRPVLPVPAVRLLVHRRGQPADDDEQFAKLELIVAVADEVWGI